MNYVMTLSGPKLKRPTLLGVTDTVRAHPLAIVGGLLAGLFLGVRSMRKRSRR